MGDGDQPKPVDKIADDIIKDDVKKQGQGGRPGKGRGIAQLPARPKLLATVGALVLLAGGTTVYYLVTRDYSRTTTSTQSTAPPGAPTATVSPGTAGAIDDCLVGTWRSDGIVKSITPGVTGLAGIRITFDPNGTETIDYSAAQPAVQTIPTDAGPLTNTRTLRGTAAAVIATDKGTARIVTVKSSDVTIDYEGPGNRRRDAQSGPAGLVAGLGLNPVNRAYTCTPTTLTYDTMEWTLSFTRVPQTRSKPSS